MDCCLFILGFIPIVLGIANCVCLGWASFYNKDHDLDNTIRGLLWGAIICEIILLISICVHVCFLESVICGDDNECLGFCMALPCICIIISIITSSISVGGGAYEQVRSKIQWGFGFSIANVILLLITIPTTIYKFDKAESDYKRRQLQTTQSKAQKLRTPPATS